MQSQPTHPSSADRSDSLLHSVSLVPGANYSMTEESTRPVNEPMRFQSRYIDYMEMSADACTVAAYFDDHHAWFRRCAQPMKAEPIGQNGYILVIGRFGAFGYEVEPKIGLDLLPQQEGVYRIETIAIPDYAALGYDVDFKAAMELVEVAPEESSENGRSLERITRVQWDLDLTVMIHFPRFIHALPKGLLQRTGDRLLNQIVRQVSRKLNRKVLEDFHHTHNVPIPTRNKKWLFQKAENDLELDPQDKPDRF